MSRRTGWASPGSLTTSQRSQFSVEESSFPIEESSFLQKNLHFLLKNVDLILQYRHNKLMAASLGLQFCKRFENAPLNGSLGWTQTSGVTTVAEVSTDAFLVCYNRVCCPTVKTDCHAAPPAECECDGTETFCMKGRVVPVIPSPPPAPPAPPPGPPMPCVPPMQCLEAHGNATLVCKYTSNRTPHHNLISRDVERKITGNPGIASYGLFVFVDTAVTTDTGLCAPAPGKNISHVVYSGALCGANGSKAIQWRSAYTIDPRKGLPPASCKWDFNPDSVEGRKHMVSCGSCVRDPYGVLRLPTHVC